MAVGVCIGVIGVMVLELAVDVSDGFNVVVMVGVGVVVAMVGRVSNGGGGCGPGGCMVTVAATAVATDTTMAVAGGRTVAGASEQRL